MSIYVLTNNSLNYNWYYIPQNGNINSQIILYNEISIYNFNGDIYEDYIGKINSLYTELFGIYENDKYFKRQIINPYEIHIIEIIEITQQNVNNKVSTNDVNILIEQ